jgi:hypothetical protein
MKPALNVPVYEGVCAQHGTCRQQGRPTGVARCPLCQRELRKVRHIGWAMNRYPEWEAIDARLREQRARGAGFRV